MEPAREYFWGCELTKDNPAVTWSFEEEEGDTDYLIHTLFLKHATLGPSAVSDERNIVQVETKNFDNAEIKQTFLSLTLGKSDMCSLDVSFGHEVPVTFRLIEGNGPVHISAQQLVEFPDEGNQSQNESELECTETEEEDLEEEDESPQKGVKAKKRKASSQGTAKSKKGKMELSGADSEEESEEDEDDEEEDDEEEEDMEEDEDEEEEDEEDEESSPEKSGKKAKGTTKKSGKEKEKKTAKKHTEKTKQKLDIPYTTRTSSQPRLHKKRPQSRGCQLGRMEFFPVPQAKPGGEKDA